ncbi:hypothetical protein L915_04962 [Phytophthora nicotianae]|uniref:FCH domain-containing protein n=1 Tax=Phytophthora nicotianae TaxID=4792 RepID=W2HAH8_PHYNI|nr:hypothetical protein L915_04962 [Phytophthora nicotianae]
MASSVVQTPALGLESPSSSPSEPAFATDLLFNLDDVRAACVSDLAAHANLVTMLRSRINLERTYAQELNRMARHSHLGEMDHGTMKNAMESLRSQYLNTSVQHQHLAKNLEEDVLQPIEVLYEYNSERVQSLTRRINNAKKDVKAQEDFYRKDYSTFDKNFREASTAFSAAMNSGFSSTILEDQYHRRLSQLEDTDSPVKAKSSTALTTRTEKPSGAAALKSIHNRKLVSWLRPSSDSHRKEELGNNTVKLMATAEKSRMKCQQTWQEVEANRIRMYRTVQAVLADYQQIAEDRIETITTNLRKHVVFASSALANEQYDWQTVAPKLEDVDAKSDIRDFIHSIRGHKGRIRLTSLTVNDLCNDTTRFLIASPSSKPCRPLRKTCLEIRDISSKKVPFDNDGNQELLCEVLDARSGEVETHEREKVQDQGICTQEEYSRFRIDFSAAENDSSVNVDTSVAQADGDHEFEEKKDIAQQNEPENDCDETTPNVSPSESSGSLKAHFLTEDELGSAQHEPILVSKDS